MNKIYIIIVVFLVSQSCFSQDRDGYQVMITTENDSFMYFFKIPNNDDHYTGGAKVELFTPEIDKWMPFCTLKNAEKNRSTFGLTITAFTPLDLGADIQYGDRPYASYTALSFGKESYAEKSFLKSELYLGFFGFDLAKNAQRYMHQKKWFGTKRIPPEGWHNQIGDEDNNFTFNYAISYLKNMASSNGGFVAAYRLDTNIGNYMTDFAAGLHLGYYLNTSPFVSGSIPKERKKDAKGMKMRNTKRAFRFRVFAEPKLKHVLYNSTLEGALFGDHSVYTIPHSDIRRYQFEYNAGIDINFWDTIYCAFTLSGRSQEFKNAKEFHYWGGVSLGWRWE